MSNYLTQARRLITKGIKDSKNVPANMKPEALSIANEHIKLLSETLATIELAVRREQHK